MNIGIDVRILERPLSGIGRFLQWYLWGFKQFVPQHNFFLFSNTELMHDTYGFPLICKGGPLFQKKVMAPLWMNTVLPSLLKQHNIDVFFSPNHAMSFKQLPDTKNVAMIHDLFQKIRKDFHPASYRYYLNFIFPFIFRNSDAIIAISEHTKQDIITYYKIPPEKIDVVYHSIPDKFRPRVLTPEERSLVKQATGREKDFSLFVGVIEPRKNITMLISVAKRLREAGFDHPIVVAGKSGPNGAPLKEAMDREPNIIHTDHINDTILPLLYNAATTLLFPTWYEGFGLPALEAMQSGLPVITSDSSSLPEVVDNAGILIPPHDAEGFTRAVMKLIDSESERARLAQLGMKRAEMFTLEKSMKSMISIFEKAAGKL